MIIFLLLSWLPFLVLVVEVAVFIQMVTSLVSTVLVVTVLVEAILVPTVEVITIEVVILELITSLCSGIEVFATLVLNGLATNLYAISIVGIIVYN